MELVSDLNTNINIEGNVLPDLKYLICALSFHNSPNICSFFGGGGKGSFSTVEVFGCNALQIYKHLPTGGTRKTASFVPMTSVILNRNLPSIFAVD